MIPKLSCGCKLTFPRETPTPFLHIEFCPLHAAAPKMKEVIVQYLEWRAKTNSDRDLLEDDFRAAIAETTKGTTNA